MTEAVRSLRRHYPDQVLRSAARSDPLSPVSPSSRPRMVRRLPQSTYQILQRYLSIDILRYMAVETNLSNHGEEPHPEYLPNPEPRRLTDPRAMRAVAHPVRIALLEVLSVEGPLTATQAGEMIGESPTTCSFHLRQLAKYGFIEEVAGVAGRKRPWRIVSTGLSYSDVSDDLETRLAGTALSRVLHDFYLDRLKEGLELRRDSPEAVQKATGSSEFLLYATVEELQAVDEQITALIKPFYERIGNPKKRPVGALPIELLLFAYPRPANRTHLPAHPK
jgi:predicted ArsR family transcriptional regulator